MRLYTFKRPLIFFFILAFTVFTFYHESSLSNDEESIGQWNALTYNKDLEFYNITEDDYIVNAFLDERNGNKGYRYVRMLAVLKSTNDFECKIDGKSAPEIKLYELSENHRMKFKVFIVSCKVPTNVNFHNVSFVEIAKKGGQYKNVPIEYYIRKESSYRTYKYKMSTCVPVLFGKKYDYKRFIEFVELNRLQGIEKIFIYYEPDSMNEDLIKVFNYYKNISILHPIEFNLPFDKQKIWYHGQLIAITDCLLKNTGVSKYTFFNDLDEFFVPTNIQMSLLETMESIFSNKLIGSQRVPTRYVNIKNSKLPITLHNSISSPDLETRFTKCVVRPEMVYEQGIHHTSSVIQDNYITNNHNGSLVQLFHFKEKKYCCKNESTLILRYSKELKSSYENVLKLFK